MLIFWTRRCTDDFLFVITYGMTVGFSVCWLVDLSDGRFVRRSDIMSYRSNLYDFLVFPFFSIFCSEGQLSKSQFKIETYII